MKCKNCGKEYDESAKFCPECGSKINRCEGNSLQSKPPVEVEGDEPPKKPNKTVLGILYGIIILGLVCLAVAIVNLNDSGVPPETQATEAETITTVESDTVAKVIKETRLKSGPIYELIKNTSLPDTFTFTESLFEDGEKSLDLKINKEKSFKERLDDAELFLLLFTVKNDKNASIYKYGAIHIDVAAECSISVLIKPSSYTGINEIKTFLLNTSNKQEYLDAYRENDFFRSSDMLLSGGLGYIYSEVTAS